MKYFSWMLCGKKQRAELNQVGRCERAREREGERVRVRNFNLQCSLRLPLRGYIFIFRLAFPIHSNRNGNNRWWKKKRKELSLSTIWFYGRLYSCVRVCECVLFSVHWNGTKQKKTMGRSNKRENARCICILYFCASENGRWGVNAARTVEQRRVRESENGGKKTIL